MIDASKIRHATIMPDEHEAFVRSIEMASKVDGCFVEIGVQRGDGTAAIIDALTILGQKRMVVSIDPTMNRDGIEEVIEGSSQHHDLIFRQSDQYKPPRQIAWVFVDGCHCYHCVREDLDRYGARVVPGGVVVMHDTTHGLPGARRKYYTGQQFCYRLKSKTIYGVHWARLSSLVLTEKFDLIEEVGLDKGLSVYQRR